MCFLFFYFCAAVGVLTLVFDTRSRGWDFFSLSYAPLNVDDLQLLHKFFGEYYQICLFEGIIRALDPPPQCFKITQNVAFEFINFGIFNELLALIVWNVSKKKFHSFFLIEKDLEKRERRVIYVLSHNTWENLLQMTSRHTRKKRHTLQHTYA